MPLSRPDLPYRGRFNPIHWAMAYPFFAVAVVLFVGFFSVFGWMIAKDFVLPGGFVVVDVYPINLTQTQGDITINYTRMTYQPGFRKRLSRWLEDSSQPLLMIDGWLVNGGSEPLAAFTDTPERPAGVTFFDGPDGDTQRRATISGEHTCDATGTDLARTAPGLRRRISIVLPTSDRSLKWILKSVENGRLPAHELGAMSFGNCDGEPGTQFQETTVFRFDEVSISRPIEHDYYPFGGPTAGRLSVNDRPYWNIWLPRGDVK